MLCSLILILLLVYNIDLDSNEPEVTGASAPPFLNLLLVYIIDLDSNEPGVTGALFLAVCRGKGQRRNGLCRQQCKSSSHCKKKLFEFI